MWQWCVSGSSNEVVILVSPNTAGHSADVRLVVMTMLVRSLSLETLEAVVVWVNFDRLRVGPGSRVVA